MHKKNILLLIFFLLSSVTFSQVITSKKEAIKKGVYEKPVEKNVAIVSNPLKANNGVSNLNTGAKGSLAKTNKTVSKGKSKKSIINDKPDNDLILEPAENYMALQMINNAMEFVGVNYRGGGTSKAGMDCSGMVTAVFNIFGMKLPRSSRDMATVGEKLAQSDIKKGDLVFFRTNGKDTINHVGMVVETDGDEIKFIHSSTQKGVIISSTKEPYYKKTFAQANRVIM